MFIAFDNKGMQQNFCKYFKELLKLYSADSGDVVGATVAAAAAAVSTENGK